MIKHLLFFLIVTSVTSHCIAQNTDANNVRTQASLNSTASSQGGSIHNTDLFTGTTTVNVPIYDYGIDGVGLGVGISYSTSGIKVDEVASSVGLGWNLQGIPYIDRIPNFLEDEVVIDQSGKPKQFGDWQCRQDYVISNDDPTKLSYDRNGNDVFIVNLGGRQVKFTIDLGGSTGGSNNNLKISTYPKSELKIELLYNNTPVVKGINWWNPNSHAVSNFQIRITDEQNNIYYFDKVDCQTNKKYEWGDGTVTTYSSPVKWWCSKVVTYTGAVIDYTYTNSTISYKSYRKEEIMESFPEHCTSGSNSFTAYGIVPLVVANEEVSVNVQANIISEIKYPNGDVLAFFYKTNTRCDMPNGYKALNTIKIKGGYEDPANNYIEYNFNHSYYASFGSNSEVAFGGTCNNPELEYRLKLNSIDRKVNGGQGLRYYTFTYNNAQLPSRLSPSTDYYGYYNGQTPIAPPSNLYNNQVSGTTPVFSIPKHLLSFTQTGTNPTSLNLTYGVDKTPDFNYLQTGVLTKVKNSYGGEMEIVYEPHSLSFPSNQLFISTCDDGNNTYDGLRTQKIIYNDGFSDEHKKIITYSYTNGQIFNKYLYYWYPTLINPCVLIPSGPASLTWTSSAYSTQRKWSNSPVNKIGLYNGSNHGYSEVMVSETNNANTVLSRKKYYYSNLLRGNNEPAQTFSNASGADNLLIKILDFKRNNLSCTQPSILFEYAIGNLLKEESYIASNTQPYNAVQYEYDVVIPSYDPALNPPNGSLPGEIIQSDFSVPCCSLYSNTAYESLYNQVYEKAFVNKKWRLIKTTTTDYSSSTSSQVVTEYEYDGRDNIKKTKWTDSRGDNYVKDNAYLYDYVPSSGRETHQHVYREQLYKVVGGVNYYLSKNEKSFDAYSLIPDIVNTFKTTEPSTTANTTVDFEVKLRDAKNNAIEIEQENGLSYSCKLWDYKLGQVVAEVSNAKFEDIGISSFEGLNGGTIDVYQKGGLQFNTNGVVLAANTPKTWAATGKYIYQLNTSAHQDISKDLKPNTTYLLSFCSDVPLDVTINGSAITMDEIKTIGVFDLYTAYITTNSNSSQYLLIKKPASVTSASQGFVDEVRIRPANSKVITYTYQPLFGESAVCDDASNIIFTHYDSQGRVWKKINTHWKIISQIDRTVQGNN